MQHPGGTLARLNPGTGRMADDKPGPGGPALESRDPGQTGCRPLRPLTPCRDPIVLAKVLEGLHRLPDGPPPDSPRKGFTIRREDGVPPRYP